MTYTEYTEDLILLGNTPAPVESWLHHLEQTAGDIGLCMYINKTESMRFKQKVASL